MAKQILNAAIRGLPEDSPLVFRIFRRPFQLDSGLLEAPEPAPGAATESVAKRDRLWLVDGGDVDDMANLHRQGAEHGVRFSFDGPVTNSRSSLRLVLWAQSLGRNEELMAALGWRHFGEDAPLSDPTTLLDSCVEAGLDRTAAAAVLAGDDYGDAVDASHAAWAGLRKLQGIPLCVFNCYHPHLDVSQRLRVSGSAPAAEHARVFREIERTAREPPTWRFAPAAKTYVVAHAPAVAVRERSTTASPVLRYHRPGTVVAGYGVLDGWLKLAGESGWMLLAHRAHGALLEPR